MDGKGPQPCLHLWFCPWKRASLSPQLGSPEGPESYCPKGQPAEPSKARKDELHPKHLVCLKYDRLLSSAS